MQLPSELSELVLSKATVGRKPVLDAIIFDHHLHSRHEFLDALVEQDATDSITFLRQRLTRSDLARCLHIASDKNAEKVICLLFHQLHLKQKTFRRHLTRILRSSKDPEKLRRIFRKIVISSDDATHLLDQDNPHVPLYQLFLVLKEFRARFASYSVQLMRKVVQYQDSDALELLKNEGCSSYIGRWLDPDTLEPEFLLKIISVGYLDKLILSYNYRRIFHVDGPFKGRREVVLSVLENPAGWFDWCVKGSMFDVAEMLIHVRNLEWKGLSSTMLLFCWEWPDSLLDAYLSRLTCASIKLSDFFQPHFMKGYMDNESYNNKSRKIIHACLRVGVIIDAVPDLALAWACQVGDVDAVYAHVDLVPLQIDDKSPFMELAVSWDRAEVVEILNRKMSRGSCSPTGDSLSSNK